MLHVLSAAEAREAQRVSEPAVKLVDPSGSLLKFDELSASPCRQLLIIGDAEVQRRRAFAQSLQSAKAARL
eukprot:4813839-Prymnesium_polylepis.1